MRTSVAINQMVQQTINVRSGNDRWLETATALASDAVKGSLVFIYKDKFA